MPNAMQRSKTNPLIKLEKNTENNDIRRRLNVSAMRDRSAAVGTRGAGAKMQPEPFWERLSKVKRVPSQTNLTEFSSGSHMYLIQGSSQSRIPPQRSSIPHPQKPFKKQVTPTYMTPKLTVDTKKAGRKPAAKKEVPFLTPPQSTPKLNLYNPGKRIKEILHARSVCTSNTSSEFIHVKPSAKNRSKSPLEKTSQYYSQSSDFNYIEVSSKGISNDSLEEYEMPPLIKVPTTDSLTSSVNIRNDFMDLLEQKNCSMEPDEISVIKNVVKIDERHHRLQRNDSQLFKSILRSQLKEILKQETVVKNALTKLDERFSGYSKMPDTSQLDDEFNSEEPKVNVTFKNVPTLEKEIIILKALGERLEATLQRSGATRLSSRSNAPNVSNPLQMRKITHFVMGYGNCCQVSVRAVGKRIEKGYVKEFRIARKTIVELKENAGKHFYLPMDNEKNELKRTSFRKLKENPDILMRHLKPKNSLVPFNVLDHDPIFFNSFLHNMNPSAQAEPTKSEDETSKLDDYSDEISSEGVPIREGGDSTIYKQTRLETKSREDKQQLPVIWDDDEDDDLEEEPEEPKYGLMQQRKKLREIKEKEFKIWEVGPEDFQNENSELTNVKEIKAKNDPKKGKSTEPQTAVSKSKPKTKKKKDDNCQSGDSKDKENCEKKIEVDIPLEKPESKEQSSATTPAQSSESNLIGSVLFQAPLRGNKRRRIRRCVTPLPMEKEIEPKNRLVKTVLVGIVQVSVFLILIMAITFPDIRCF